MNIRRTLTLLATVSLTACASTSHMSRESLLKEEKVALEALVRETKSVKTREEFQRETQDWFMGWSKKLGKLEQVARGGSVEQQKAYAAALYQFQIEALDPVPRVFMHFIGSSNLLYQSIGGNVSKGAPDTLAKAAQAGDIKASTLLNYANFLDKANNGNSKPSAILLKAMEKNAETDGMAAMYLTLMYSDGFASFGRPKDAMYTKDLSNKSELTETEQNHLRAFNLAIEHGWGKRTAQFILGMQGMALYMR